MPLVILNVGGTEWRRIRIPNVTPEVRVPILRQRDMLFNDQDVVQSVGLLTLRFKYCFVDPEDDTNVYELDGVL